MNFRYWHFQIWKFIGQGLVSAAAARPRPRGDPPPTFAVSISPHRGPPSKASRAVLFALDARGAATTEPGRTAPRADPEVAELPRGVRALGEETRRLKLALVARPPEEAGSATVAEHAAAFHEQPEEEPPDTGQREELFTLGRKFIRRTAAC
jgi:hypothetical protein